MSEMVNEAEEQFKCPQCGGPHFGSSPVPGKDEENRVYYCHGYEVQFRDHKDFPGWPSCGWRGSRAECMNKENQ